MWQPSAVATASVRRCAIAVAVSYCVAATNATSARRCIAGITGSCVRRRGATGSHGGTRARTRDGVERGLGDGRGGDIRPRARSEVERRLRYRARSPAARDPRINLLRHATQPYPAAWRHSKVTRCARLSHQSAAPRDLGRARPRRWWHCLHPARLLSVVYSPARRDGGAWTG